MIELDNHLYVSKEASVFLRNTVDRIYLEDNYHCCTSGEFQIWHIGDCCPHNICFDEVNDQGQGVLCSDFWEQRKKLDISSLRGNDFLPLLRARGAAVCVIETRKAYIIWGHDNQIYNLAIPEHLKDELVLAAKANRLYSRATPLPIYANTKGRFNLSKNFM
jgi:hypothetical protein